MENKVWCITRYNDYYETYCLVLTRVEVNGFTTRTPLLFIDKDKAQQSIDRVMAENKELKKENEELRRRLANVQIAALGCEPVREVENIA